MIIEKAKIKILLQRNNQKKYTNKNKFKELKKKNDNNVTYAFCVLYLVLQLVSHVCFVT